MALTWTCQFRDNPGEMHSTQIVFDPAERWYTGTGKVRKTQTDAWSVASHELGRVTGFTGHFSNDNSDLCPRTAGRHTMCVTTIPGTTSQRDIGPHDADTFQNAYPPPPPTTTTTLPPPPTTTTRPPPLVRFSRNTSRTP